MKKICLIFITLLFMLIMVGCEGTPQNSKYIVTVVNGVIKDENVDIKEVNSKDIITVVPTGDIESFTGWYVKGELVSENQEYTFQVDKSITVEARFGASAEGLKNGYYILNRKIENGLDLSNSELNVTHVSVIDNDIEGFEHVKHKVIGTQLLVVETLNEDENILNRFIKIMKK